MSPLSAVSVLKEVASPTVFGVNCSLKGLQSVPTPPPNPDPEDDPPEEDPAEDAPFPDDVPQEMPPNDDPTWNIPDEMALSTN